MKTHHIATVERIQSAKTQMLIFCSLLFIFSCSKEPEITEHSYPQVTTGLVTNIHADGATFNGSFLHAGKSEIIDHGFVFDTYELPNIQRSEKISLGSSNGSGSFTAIASVGMISGKKYYVSAYAQNQDQIFYADPVSFVSMGSASPEIVMIEPSEGVIGETVVIKGKYFSQQPLNNTVKFGDADASIVAVSDTELTVRVPTSNGNEHVDVFVTTTGKTAQKISGFKYLKPEITGLSSTQGVVGDIVTINGQFFTNNISNVRVYCSDFQLDIVSCSENKIVVTIPNTTASAKTPIRVSVDGIEGTSNASFEIISPWTKKATLPTRVNAFPIFASYNNNGYIVDYSSWQYCWKYNPVKNLWQMLISNIGNFSQRENPDFFQIDDLWFVGFTGGSLFYQVSLESLQREELSYPSQGILIYTFSFIINGKAYVCGGYNGFHFGNTVRQYDPQTKKWTIKASLPGPWRNRGIAFSHNGKGYAGWGAGETGSGVFAILNDFYEYNLQTDTWTQKTDFPGKAVSGAISFVVNGRIFAGLGVTQEGNTTESIRDIWEYNIDNDTWTRVAIIPNNGGEGAYVFVIDNKAYIGGGYSNSSYFGYYGTVNQDFYEFDPSKL